MSTPARVVAFVAGLAAIFGLAFGVGRIADPDTAPVAAHGDEHAGDEHEAMGEPAAVHLALTSRELAPGRQDVAFQVQDQVGRAVTTFDTKHEKDLHLIVLDTRDLTDFQHVHPSRAADGTWAAQLVLQSGTSYRMYADGSTHGQDFVATADIHTTGHHPGPRGVPEPATRDRVDGLNVDLANGHDAARLAVTRDGRPVELEPYLGALGHLVVIRVDDLSYLHVHPEEGATPTFAVAGLAPGRYRYFFDFKVGGVVRTAAYTVDVTRAGSHD
jgi:hypothetical protein